MDALKTVLIWIAEPNGAPCALCGAPALFRSAQVPQQIPPPDLGPEHAQCGRCGSLDEHGDSGRVLAMVAVDDAADADVTRAALVKWRAR